MADTHEVERCRVVGLGYVQATLVSVEALTAIGRYRCRQLCHLQEPYHGSLCVSIDSRSVYLC